MSKLEKPNIILASPPCESWSHADCGGRMFRSVDSNNNWTVKNRKYYHEYNKKCHPVKRRYFEQKEISRLNGMSTIGGTIKIIEHFQPEWWIIENPLTSLTWKFQEYHWDFKGHINKTYYSAYDLNFSAKPTVFKSNNKLNLKSKKIQGNASHMANGNYSKRSAIPTLLIKHIIDQINLSWDKKN